MQIADVVLISADTRGFGTATRLAKDGWKVVVIELSGREINKHIEISDRLGPFSPLASSLKRDGEKLADGYLWLRSSPVALSGPCREIGTRHLQRQYGLGLDFYGELERRLLTTGIGNLETKVSEGLNIQQENQPYFWERRVREVFDAHQLMRDCRQMALEAGVRVVDADTITGIRVRDRRIDRISYRDQNGAAGSERTRSVVWLLSLEESKFPEYISNEVDLAELVWPSRKLEQLVSWWRSRVIVTVMTDGVGKGLPGNEFVPEIPSLVIHIGTIEKPWTHHNLLVMDLVEKAKDARVFDVWMRLPYWARADHVYRDEQRTLARLALESRIPGCQLAWVSPSPLGLSEPAIRMPHIVYAEGSEAPRSKLSNMVYAGPDSWKGIGLLGIELMEPDWMSRLQKMRIEWDAAARITASRWEQLKIKMRAVKNHNVEKVMRSKSSHDAGRDVEHKGDMLP